MTENPDAFFLSCSSITSTFPTSSGVVISHARQPIIAAAMILASQGTRAVVVEDDERSSGGSNTLGVISARQIIGRLVEPHDVWRLLLKMACGDAAQPALLVQDSETIFSLLGKMFSSRKDIAIFENDKSGQVSVIDPLVLVNFIAFRKSFESFLRHYACADIHSGLSIVSVRVEDTLRETMLQMIKKGVGRVVLRENQMVFSDRGIIKLFFGSIQIMELLRDDPDVLLNAPLSEFSQYFQTPGVVRLQDDLGTVVDRLIRSEAKCCVLDDLSGIVTPWDLTVGLYQRIRPQAGPT